MNYTDHCQPDHPLKIGILHYACAPVVGGVEGVITTHARLLERAGHHPFIIAGRGNPARVGLNGTIIPEIDSRQPAILQLQAALLRSEPGALAEFERWTDHIHGLLLDALQGCDVCVVHNAFTLHKNLPLTVALARLAKDQEGAARWIAWSHDLAWLNPLYEEELLSQWPWTPLKYALPNVTYVAVSERRREEMAMLFRVEPSEIALVPNGIDPGQFIPTSPEMAALRDRLKWDERDWVFLAPLRITRRKNLELAIDIVAALRDLGVRPLLVVTGPPGPHNPRSGDYLRELIERRAARGVEAEVTFLSVEGGEDGGLDVSDALVGELYWWSDALLMPSAQEGFGLPLIEAGLARLPVFCSDIPVLREVGGHNVNFFPPDGDPVEIATSILGVLRRPGPAPYRRKVLSTFGWDAIFATRIMPLLCGVINAGSAGPIP